MDTPIIEKVIQHLQSLPQELQWRVLEFTRALALSTPQGVPGQQLLKFAGGISQEDLKKMQETIDQGCEQVDSDEW